MGSNIVLNYCIVQMPHSTRISKPRAGDMIPNTDGVDLSEGNEPKSTRLPYASRPVLE